MAAMFSQRWLPCFHSNGCHVFTEMVPFLKPRSQTFSYSTTSTLPDVRVNTPAAKDTRAGILPNFVFLQLYHMGILHVNSVPIPIPEGNEVSELEVVFPTALPHGNTALSQPLILNTQSLWCLWNLAYFHL